MRAKLPLLTKKRLRWLFDHVYDEMTVEAQGEDVGFSTEGTLLLVVKLMQQANLKYRSNECAALFHLFSEPGFLETNSEGATQWLAMALAIKQLCSLKDEELQQVVYGCY